MSLNLLVKRPVRFSYDRQMGTIIIDKNVEERYFMVNFFFHRGITSVSAVK